MNDTKSLLAFIYKNAEMGVQTMPKIAEHATGDFKNAVENRLDKYRQIRAEAQQLMEDDGNGDTEHLGLNGFEKTSSDMMLKMNLRMNDTVPHMADMLIRGSSMGIRDIAEQMEKYQGADRRAMRLAEKLKQLEQDGLEEMRKYLDRV